MNPPDSTPRRRATDKWTDERLDDALGRLDNVPAQIGSLEARVGRMEERLNRAVADIAKIDLPGTVEQIRELIEKLDAKLEGDLAHLDDHFLTRESAKSEYIPRAEHERRWAARQSWPMIFIAALNVFVVITLHYLT